MRVRPLVLRRLARLWLAAVGVALAVMVAMSAHAAFSAVADQRARAAARDDRLPIGHDADDHFPGAALLYAPPDVPAPLPTAAPAQGVTGTIALPALPVPAAAAQAAVAADVGIVPARPFSLAGASAQDRGRALDCLTSAIYYEAASEPDAGQAAVAQVILNRVRHPAFPATVCGVVYQGSERRGCQFSFACDGAMARLPAHAAWTRAARAAGAALAGYVYAPVGLATHYHTYAVTPAWNRSLVMTDAVGVHFFHRWKGYWGTAAAFRQPYKGGEPVPGPHTRASPPPAAQTPIVVDPAVLAAVAPPPAPKPITPPATVQPRYRDSGMAVAAAAKPDDPDDQILPQWRDSGKPLHP